MFLKFFLLFILSLSLIPDLYGRSFYVSTSGNDLNNGLSVSSPWRTLTKVNATAFLPGDTIKFRGGEIFESNTSFAGAKLWITNSGAPGLPIVYTSYGTGKPVIKADTVGIYVVNKSYVKINNISVKGNFNPFSQNNTVHFNNTGIYILNTGATLLKDITIDSCRITNFLSSALQVSSTNAPAFDGIYVTNCRVDSIGDTGIFFVTGISYSFSAYPIKNITIRNCEISRVTGIDTRVFTGDGILLISVDSALVERNLVYDCGGGGLQVNGPGPSAIEATECRNIILQYNETYGTKSNTGSDGHGCHFDEGVQNSVMQYNYSHGNDGPGFSCHMYAANYPLSDSNNTIRYNISAGNLRRSDFQNGEITVSSFQATIYDIHVYNNTIFAQKSPQSPGDCAAILIARNARNIYIRNNSIITADSNVYQWYHFPLENSTNIVLQGNSYWSLDNKLRFREGINQYKSFSQWQSASGKELLNNVNTGITADPNHINAGISGAVNNPYMLDTLSAYKFRSISALKDNALNQASLFGINTGEFDFYGLKLNSGADCGTDIGAYESNGINLKVKIYAEGLYNEFSNFHTPDTFQIQTASANPPYEISGTYKSVSGTDGNGNYYFDFLNASLPFGNYYIIVKQRNSIETWSAAPVYLHAGCNAEFDFTSDSSSAFGKNLVRKGGKYCIYSGDINQDGVIDITDNSAIETDMFNFLKGYNLTDLNGDLLTDIQDIAISENNSFMFVTSVKP